MSMVDDIPLLTELADAYPWTGYKHLAPGGAKYFQPSPYFFLMYKPSKATVQV